MPTGRNSRQAIVGPLMFVTAIACSATESDERADVSDPEAVSVSDTSNDPLENGMDADATPDAGAEVTTDGTHGIPCPGRDPVCDSPIAPLPTALSRGITGLAVYESDWIRCPYGADCYTVALDVLLVETETEVDDPQAARVIVNANANGWQRFDERFEIATEEGLHLLCARPAGYEAGFEHCAAVRFDTATVVTVILWSTFGPGLMYVVRNADDERLPTFQLPGA